MRKLFAMVALAALVACGGDSVTNPSADQVTGTYTLQSIDGDQLPVTYQSGGNSLTITSDVLTVADNGTWTETYSYRQTINGQTSNGTGADGGTWTRAGSNVEFYSNQLDDFAYFGTYNNNRRLDLSDGLSDYVFTR